MHGRGCLGLESFPLCERGDAGETSSYARQRLPRTGKSCREVGEPMPSQSASSGNSDGMLAVPRLLADSNTFVCWLEEEDSKT